VRLTIDKNQMLQECDIQFEILQEYNESGRGGRVHLGNVKLNLAEYAQLPEALTERDPQDESDDGGITRRYLLQDSKVNSTLKVGIKMKQTEGDTNFVAPPLKSAMVIGGIAGVLTTEAGEGDDIPSITSKTRELSEAQDIYRRTLAATWACQAGELAPDKLIEDLFCGGDGGKIKSPANPAHHQSRLSPREESLGSSSSEETRRPVTPRSQHLTPQMANHHGHRRGGSADGGNTNGQLGGAAPLGSVSGRSSIEQQMHASQQDHHHSRRRDRADYRELTEFDLRDDLRSWQVRVS
jgi:hypothetical protein